MSEQPSITCPRCGATSYHPEDIAQGYCGACHDWTSDLRGRVRDRMAAEGIPAGTDDPLLLALGARPLEPDRVGERGEQQQSEDRSEQHVSDRDSHG